MKDVEKTNVERNNSSKRMRRRRRKMNLYGLIVILLVATVGITVSYTFLFNINEIRVSGESDEYTAEEIVNASGISKGDNLLRLNAEKSEQNILDNLLYIETASIDRDFPSSLEIKVSKCVPAFNVNYGTGTLLVSKKGKILADNAFITDGLPIIYGYEPSIVIPGKQIQSADEQKGEAFTELIAKMNNSEDNMISSIDMSDKYAIIVNYYNGIIFKMGNWTDVEYKLNMAQDVMNNENVKGKTGYITMVGSNQCSFRSGNTSQQIPVTDPTQPSTEGAVQPVTGANGIPAATQPETATATASSTVIQDDIYNEDEAIFDEYNQQFE